MNDVQDKLFVETFPKLYAHRHGDMRSTCMIFGFCIGPGWFNLLYKMSERLEKLINSLPEWCEHCSRTKEEHPYQGQWKEELIECNEFKPTWLKAVQVKEKFGGPQQPLLVMQGTDPCDKTVCRVIPSG